MFVAGTEIRPGLFPQGSEGLGSMEGLTLGSVECIWEGLRR